MRKEPPGVAGGSFIVSGRGEKQDSFLRAICFGEEKCPSGLFGREYFAGVCVGEEGQAVARTVDKADVIISAFALHKEADVDLAVEVFAGKVGKLVFPALAHRAEKVGKR